MRVNEYKRLAKWLTEDEHEAVRKSDMSDKDICVVAGRRGGLSPEANYKKMMAAKKGEIIMKLTMTCPECRSMFDEGMVAEVGGDSLESLDICEYEGQNYICKTCGHEEKIVELVPKNEAGHIVY